MTSKSFESKMIRLTEEIKDELVKMRKMGEGLK